MNTIVQQIVNVIFTFSVSFDDDRMFPQTVQQNNNVFIIFVLLINTYVIKIFFPHLGQKAASEGIGLPQ